MRGQARVGVGEGPPSIDEMYVAGEGGGVAAGGGVEVSYPVEEPVVFGAQQVEVPPLCDGVGQGASGAGLVGAEEGRIGADTQLGEDLFDFSGEVVGTNPQAGRDGAGANVLQAAT